VDRVNFIIPSRGLPSRAEVTVLASTQSPAPPNCLCHNYRFRTNSDAGTAQFCANLHCADFEWLGLTRWTLQVWTEIAQLYEVAKLVRLPLGSLPWREFLRQKYAHARSGKKIGGSGPSAEQVPRATQTDQAQRQQQKRW